MALQKQDPLPPGRYWIDVFGDEHRVLFEAWVTLHDVHVETSEERAGDDNTPRSWFFLFTTTTEVPWRMAPVLGWPTIADPGVQSSDDTSTAPEAKQAVQDEAWSSFATAGLGGIGIALLLLWLLGGKK